MVNQLTQYLKGSHFLPAGSMEDPDGPFHSLIHLLGVLYTRKYQSGPIDYQCIVDLIESGLSGNRRKKLSVKVRKIGFASLKNAFQTLNRECENLLCDREDMMGIMKRHMLYPESPENEKQMIRQIGRFYHVTLIHLNWIRKYEMSPFPAGFLARKKESLDVINPLTEEVIRGIKDLLAKKEAQEAERKIS